MDETTRAQLRSFVERIERLESERRTLGEDIKEIYSEAKGTGFDPKLMRVIIRERRADPDDIAEEGALLDLYREALNG